MTEPLLRIRSLEVDYGRTQALRGVDLDVEPGSVVALIGANGAGKTTLLRSISGLVAAHAGSIRFEGLDILGQAPSRIARAGLAHAPEGRRIFSRMTVADNLRAGGYQAKTSEARRRASAIYDRFPRLAERRGQVAGLLSGGEQQMLAIGRALMSEPRLLLLDEPSMGLAPLLIEAIFTIIADLRREGKTILLVEQNARAALAVADHAYVLESGRVALSGPAAEVAQDPRVTAAYLGG